MLPERMSRAELRAGASLAGVYGLRMLGLFFILPVVAAPLLYRAVGMDGIFALTGLLSFAAIWVVKFQVPDPPAMRGKKPHEEGGGRLLDVELLRLNAGIFVLHVVLYAMFVVVPPLVVDAGLELPQHWKLYLPVVLVSFALMVPPILYADRRNRPKPVLLGGVALLLAVEAGLAAAIPGRLAAPAALMLAFFFALHFLQAKLSSLSSPLAPSPRRGVAIGVYNTTQTLGVFFGGLFGGWIGRDYGAAGVFWGCAALCAVWLAVAAGVEALRAAGNEVLGLTVSVASGGNVGGLGEAPSRVRGVRGAEGVRSGERRVGEEGRSR